MFFHRADIALLWQMLLDVTFNFLKMEIHFTEVNNIKSINATGDILFVCFVALRPKSTAMVIEGRSVHLTTLFSAAGLNKRLTSNSCTYFRL